MRVHNAAQCRPRVLCLLCWAGGRADLACRTVPHPEAKHRALLLDPRWLAALQMALGANGGVAAGNAFIWARERAPHH